MSANKSTKITLILCLMVVGYLVYHFGLWQYFTLENLKAQQTKLGQFYDENPFRTALYFLGTYILVTSLSIPGAAILTLASGAIFGLFHGSILASIGSTIGATVAFLISKFIMRGSIEKRFPNQIKKIDDGIQKDGAFYLFGLRLVPLFPFFVVNLVMGLTRIKTWLFMLVSQIGMLPATIVYVYAGQQINSINRISDITSPTLLLSFALLGLFPLIAKKTLEKITKLRKTR